MPLDSAPVVKPSVCPLDCPDTCSLDVEVEGDRLVKVRGSNANPYTAGVICAKVSNYAERAHHPQRLLQPLRRTGAPGCGRDGFVTISWQEIAGIVDTDRWPVLKRWVSPGSQNS